MSDELLLAIVGVIGSIGGGVLSMVVQRANKKHDIQKLNVERSDDLFREYKELAEKLDIKVENLENKVGALEDKIRKYEDDIRFYRDEIEKHQDIINDLENDNINLREINKQLSTENSILREQINT